MTYSQQEVLNRRVVAKLDALLLPFLSLFFLANSLDKSNIGNAETAHFTRDTGLQPEDLNTAVAFFFAFFVALQPVGAALGRRFGMVVWVPSCMAVWGLLTISHIWIGAKWQLIFIRVAIGTLEAGFYPTTVSYLSLFYTRFEFAKRLGIFYGQSAVAGALGGVISFAVFSRFPADGEVEAGAWRPWQILFLIEGTLTIIIAVSGYFWLPTGPGACWFFSAEENQWAEFRILKDRGGSLGATISKVDSDHSDHLDNAGEGSWRHSGEEEEAAGLLSGSQQVRKSETVPSATSAQGLDILDILEAVTDWKVFYLLIMNILSAIPSAAFSVFLPIIIHGFGNFTPTTANLFTAPPFVAGALVLWFFTWYSDRYRQRLKPILYGLSVLLVGLTAVVMLPHHHFSLRYIALCVLLGGSFVASPLTVAWFAGNIEEPGKRAVVLGINGWGNLAGIISSFIFSPRFAPNYETPFFITLALVMCAFVGFLTFRALLVRENRRRRRVTMAWDDRVSEIEARDGTGPSDEGIGERAWFSRLYARVTRGQYLRRRRGEDRLTFVYGL